MARGVEIGVEREIKLEAPRRWTMPRLNIEGIAEVGAPRRMLQNATYLDTLDLALLRAKHTLRRRTGGTDAGWHLKTPGDENGRVEHRLPLGRSAALVPSELHELVAPVIGGDALVPVAQLKTRRTRRELKAADGTVVALVEDDVVEATTYLDGERIHRWREVEVELVDGTPEQLTAVVQALTAKGLVVSDSPSKLSRALAEPLARITAGSADDRTAGEVVLAYVAAQVGVLQAQQQGLVEDAKDSVHKARVATRRLRSTFKTYRPLLDRVETDPIGEEVKWLTGVLGEPRDAEVLLARLTGLVDTLESDLVVGGAADYIRDTLTREHAEAHKRMVAALGSARFERLMADLTDLVLHPPLLPAAAEPAAEMLPALVAKSSAKVVRQATVAARMEDGPERDEAIHEIRKLAKAARYAAEAAGKSAGPKAKAVAGAWTDLQEALGDHQDSVVSRAAVMRLARAAAEKRVDTFTFGVLAEREYAVARSVEARYVPLLEDARKAAKKIG